MCGSDRTQQHSFEVGGGDGILEVIMMFIGQKATKTGSILIFKNA